MLRADDDAIISCHAMILIIAIFFIFALLHMPPLCAIFIDAADAYADATAATLSLLIITLPRCHAKAAAEAAAITRYFDTPPCRCTVIIIYFLRYITPYRRCQRAFRRAMPPPCLSPFRRCHVSHIAAATLDAAALMPMPSRCCC